MMLTLRKLEWAAGFLEGEGSFHQARTFGIQCSQKQREPLERLTRILGGSIYRLNPERRGEMYQWQLRGYKAAGFMMTLWTLMSPRRRGQIETALASWKPLQIRTGG